MPQIERRAADTALTPSGDGMSFEGLGAPFNSPSYIGPARRGFFEQFAPGAFARSIREGDVRSAINHDPSRLLARTGSGTLRLSEDARGLQTGIDLPDTSYGRDLSVSVARGDVSGMSVQFVARREKWSSMPGGHSQLRTLHDVDLIEVGPVTFPAYGDTTASVRTALRHAPPEVRSALAAVRQADRADDLVCDSCGATFSSDDYDEGDTCPACGEGALEETGRSRRAPGRERREVERRDGVADTSLMSMIGATDACLDAAMASTANPGQCAALLSAAAMTIDLARYGLWSLDDGTMKMFGLPSLEDIKALIVAADSAIDAALASLNAGSSDPTMLTSAADAVQKLMDVLRIDDPDEEDEPEGQDDGEGEGEPEGAAATARAPAPENRAVWSTAMVNNLPDSAFAVVLAGGTKDSEGKTVPRSLRKFPHHTTQGGVDLPHVRNGLSRAPQARIPASARTRAEAHLQKHLDAQSSTGSGRSVAILRKRLDLAQLIEGEHTHG